MKKRLFLLILICICCLSIKLVAQPLNMDTAVHPTELKLIKFSPKGEPKGKGWISISKVRQMKDTAYYFCKGLSIYSPAAVIVMAQNKENPVLVSLHKWNWKEHSRKGSTNDKGAWVEKFKTENDFGIMVVAGKKPAEYHLTIWVGEEADMELPTDFKAFDGSEPDSKVDSNSTKGGADQSFLKKNLLYIIIGVLAAAVAILMFKRKKNQA